MAHQRAIIGDQAEAVGLEQQASERGALEDGLRLGLGCGVGRRTLGQRQCRGTQLRVGLAPADPWRCTAMKSLA